MPHSPRVRRPLAAAIGAALLVAASAASAATLVACPFDAGGGDQITRGFYVTGYPGATLDTVTLQLATGISESKTITMTARAGSYGGPLIGSATASATPGTSAATTPIVFTFNNAPVTPGSTVTFAMNLDAGQAPVFYNTGVGPCAGVVQTEGTTPPLDTVRRDSVGVTITGSPTVLTAANIPLLSPLGLVALASLLAGGAGVALRRRA